MKNCSRIILGTLAGSAAAWSTWEFIKRRQKKLSFENRINKLHSIPVSQPPSRSAVIDRLKNEEFDVLIIGGGCVGAGCALDAATRGLKTAMVEMKDFAGETSSKSTKLLHGGVRYLEGAVKTLSLAKFLLVREGLRERSTVLGIAPHLGKRLDIMLPIRGFWKVPYVFSGLLLYDLISMNRSLGSSRLISKRKATQEFPGLGDVTAAVVYSDGQFNDARLAVGLSCTAALHGCAVINYTGVSKLFFRDSCVSGAECVDTLSGESFCIKTKSVINCTGPFTDQILEMASKGLEDEKTRNSAYVHQNRDTLKNQLSGLESYQYNLKNGFYQRGFRNSENIQENGTGIFTTTKTIFRPNQNSRLISKNKTLPIAHRSNNDHIDIKDSKCTLTQTQGDDDVSNRNLASTDNFQIQTKNKYQKMIAGSKGVHIVLPRHFAPKNSGMVTSTKDGRVLFFIPWQGKAVVGTTDTKCEVIQNPKAEKTDILYLLGEINKTLGIKVRKDDILAAWCGIRPLVVGKSDSSTGSSGNTKDIVRSHYVSSDNGITTICGGKWTTYRQMAEDAVDACLKNSGLKANECITQNLKIIGARNYRVDTYLKVAQKLRVTTDESERLVEMYGDRALFLEKYLDIAQSSHLHRPFDNFKVGKLVEKTGRIITKNASKDKSFFEKISIFNAKNPKTEIFEALSKADKVSSDRLMEAEIEYTCDNEMVCKITDFLARRSRIAFIDNKQAHEKVVFVASVLQKKFGWDSKKTKMEIDEAHKYLDTLGVPSDL